MTFEYILYFQSITALDVSIKLVFLRECTTDNLSVAVYTVAIITSLVQLLKKCMHLKVISALVMKIRTYFSYDLLYFLQF